MKNLITILYILISYNLSSQKWIKDTNCDEQSYEVLNEALEHFFNLEHLVAVGMAKAAYMIDSGCECSKLILAAAASPNPNWGTRKAKLDDINIQLLTSEEKTWYNMLVATLTSDGETYRSSISAGLEANPDSPLVNWFSTGGDLKKHQEFAEKFPDVASGAYNFLAYGYARGDVDGEVDFDEAYKAADMAQSLHTGPNSLDSKAEIAVIKGDYEVALSNQLKAYDYATFASPYEPKLVTYYRNTVKDEISKNLKEAQRAVQKAILDRNYEEFEKYISEDMQLISGDSNLQDFYAFNKESFSRGANVNWESFNLKDIEVSFSPDMSMAILTFYAEGSYSSGDSEDMIDYSTRASSVWIATDSGWKTVHTNWAPYGGGSGIPKI